MAIILGSRTPGGLRAGRAEFRWKAVWSNMVDLRRSAAQRAGIALRSRSGGWGSRRTPAGLGDRAQLYHGGGVMAELFVASHFYVRQAAVGFAGIDGDVEERRWLTARAVSWCSTKLRFLCFSGAGGPGAVTAWARALGEFGGTTSSRVASRHHADRRCHYRNLGERLRRGGGALGTGLGFSVRRHPGRPVLTRRRKGHAAKISRPRSSRTAGGYRITRKTVARRPRLRL